MRELSAEELQALGLSHDSNPLETAIAAEKLPPHMANFVRSVYQQESGSGNNTATSNAGAVGGMQIIPDTFKQVADPGWDIKHPIHNARAGVRYAKQMYDAAGGDPKAAAAGYYGGPDAIMKAKRGIAVSDPRNPNAPDTLGYGNSVKSRLPKLRELTPEEESALNDPVNKLQNQLKGFEDTYNAENLGGLPNVAKDVKQMSWPEQTMIKAGHETSGLIYGAKDFGNFISDLAGDPNALNRSVALHRQRDEENQLYKPFNEVSSISSNAVGGALPYFATGSLGGPVTNKAASALIDKTISVPIKAIGTEGRGLLQRATDYALNSKSPSIQKFGAQLQKDLTKPLLDKAAAKKLQVNLKDPYYNGMSGRVLGSTMLGAAEGGLNIDSNVGAGAIAGLAGGITGSALRKFTNRVPDYRTKPERELLDWYKSKGGQPSHGLDTGSAKLQNFESQLSKSGDYSDAAALYKAENQVIDNKIAYKAMGIDQSKFEHMSPTDLAEHQASLQKQYQALESGTNADITHADKKELLQHVRSLSAVPSVDSARNVKVAQKYVSAITGVKDSTEPLTRIARRPTTMSGQTFQQTRASLQADITKAYKDGDMNLVQALKPIQDKLDTAIERGVEQGKGTSTLAQWKDLNRKYAMTHIVYEHGLSPSGIDANKLYNHLSQSDPKRLFLEQGPDQLNDLQKLAKIAYMRTHQNSSMGGLKNIGARSAVQQLVGTPASLMLPGFNRVALSLYKLGIPSRTGLLNMGGSTPETAGFLSPSLPRLWGGPELYTRAIDQGSHVTDKAQEELNNLLQLLGN